MSNDRPEIIILSAFYEPWMSGAERFVKEVVERLGSRYHFSVYTSRISRSVPKRETRDGFDIIRVGFGTKYDKWFFCVLGPLAALRGEAKIAHAIMESYAGIALWVFGILRPSVKRILTLQSGDLDSDKKQRRIPGWLWKRIHVSPHLVTAISGFLAARARRLGTEERDLTVLPNGVDLAHIKPRTPERRVAHRVVCVARLSWEKGLPFLLEAMVEVKKKFSDVHLVLVGDGVLRGELERKAKDLGIADAVLFKGNLPNAEALEVVKTADVFACPSLAEGLGIVFIEAQACGVPVIGTDVGGIPDVIEDGKTGLLVPSEDPTALAASIVRLMDDRALSDGCVAEALVRLPRFDWVGIVEKAAKIYGSFLFAPSVLVAASIYPPDVGGPASQAAMFAGEWTKQGHRVTVITPAKTSSIVSENGVSVHRVGDSRGRLVQFIEILRQARRSDLVFAQDASSVSAAALAASFLARRPFVVRLGGDLLWERTAEAGKTAKGLADFYSSGDWKRSSLPHKIVLESMLRIARRVIEPNAWLGEIYAKAFGLKTDKFVAIRNSLRPMSKPEGSSVQKRVVVAGRLVPLKNLIPTLNLLKEVRASGLVGDFSVLLVGDGPLASTIAKWKADNDASWLDSGPALSRGDLLAAIAKSSLTVNLSWSEVSPNIALESLSVGTPVLLTSENGLHAELDGFADMVSPKDALAAREALVRLLSDDGQREARARIVGFRWPQTPESATGEYLELFKRVCGS